MLFAGQLGSAFDGVSGRFLDRAEGLQRVLGPGRGRDQKVQPDADGRPDSHLHDVADGEAIRVRAADDEHEQRRDRDVVAPCPEGRDAREQGSDSDRHGNSERQWGSDGDERTGCQYAEENTNHDLHTRPHGSGHGRHTGDQRTEGRVVGVRIRLAGDEVSGVPGKRRCGSRLGDVQQAGRRDGGDECARDSMHPSQDDASCSPCAGT